MGKRALSKEEWGSLRILRAAGFHTVPPSE